MIYEVIVERFGTVQVERDSIEEARRWADGAFPKMTRKVTAQRDYRHCDRCDSRPCTCQEGRS